MPDAASLPRRCPSSGSTPVGCSHGHGKGLGFGLFGFAGSWGRVPTKSLKCQENREPEKLTCHKVISGHFPAREMLPAGVSEHSPSSKTRQEARYCYSL